MAESVGWYEADGVTPLGSLNLGAVPPGQSYFDRAGEYREIAVKNDGTEPFAAVEVEIQPFSGYQAYQHLRIAPEGGTAGTPGTFQDHTANPLSLGSLAVDAVASIWVDAIVPASAEEEPQTGHLVLLATL